MVKEIAVTKYHSKLAKWKATTEKRINLDDIIIQPAFRMECINTGSTVLNMLIGGSRLPDGTFVCPGYPKGKLIEIFGRESSGKSTVAMTAMGQAISAGGVGLYVDLEHAVVDTYAMKLGVDFRPPTIGGNGMAMRVAPHTAEETEMLVNGAAIQGIDLVVVDSVAGLVSKREATRDVSDEKQKLGVAEIPRFMSNWLPKLQAICAKTGTTVIFLNQTRDKIGVKGFLEETLKSTTGGNALKFWASLRWLLQPKEASKAKIWNPLLKEFEEVPIATNIMVKNIKNKIDARQGHSGLITLRYGVGIDELRTMMNIACAYDIVKKSKNARKQEFYSYKSVALNSTIEAIGIEKFRLAMTSGSNPGAFEEMQKLCIDKIMQGFRAIDDAQLAELAEGAVATDYSAEDDDDDGYADKGDPNLVDPIDMLGADDTPVADGIDLDVSEV